MVFDYSRIANITLNQINDKGKSCVLRREAGRTYNVNTDSVSQPSTTEISTKYVRIDFKAGEVDGTLIQKDDFKALVAASSMSSRPEVGDFLIDGDRKYKIVDPKILAPSDLDILYTLQVRFAGVIETEQDHLELTYIFVGQNQIFVGENPLIL